MNAFWGKNPAGNWTLSVADSVLANTGVLRGWKLTAWGDDTPDSRYVFTDAYAKAAPATLRDNSGFDTLNAATITTDSIINLTPGLVSRIANRPLFIAPKTHIENAFGGDGNDLIIGSADANILYGARGHNVISGGGGPDTFVLSAFSDDLLLDFRPAERRSPRIQRHRG